MDEQQNPEPEIKKWIAPSVILSGICWYLSCGLHGDSWFLLWLAPFPVLVLALNLSGRKAFSISFLVYLIGRMSCFSYLGEVTFLKKSTLYSRYGDWFGILNLVASIALIIVGSSRRSRGSRGNT